MVMPDNMNDFSVLVDARPVRPPVSGVARYCIELINALEAAPSPRVSALVQGDFDHWPVTELAASVRKEHLNFLGSNRKIQNAALEFAPGVFGGFVSSRVDVVHETYFASLGSSGRAAKVSTIHDVIPLDKPELFNLSNRILSSRNFYRQAKESKQIICVSKFTRDRVLELSGIDGGKVNVIGCGVTTRPSFPADWSPREGMAAEIGDGPFVLMVGNVEPRKNIPVAAEAVALARKTHPGLKLVVAGKENFLAAEELAKARTLLPDLVYLGPVSELEKWWLIDRAATLALPSMYEGYGIPVIEAYCSNTPAVFSANTSLTELAFDERQTFDCQSAQEMAAAVTRVLDAESWLAGTVARAAAFATGNTWRSVAEATMDVYKKALAS